MSRIWVGHVKPGEGKECWVEGTKQRLSNWGIRPWWLMYPRTSNKLIYCRGTTGFGEGPEDLTKIWRNELVSAK